VVGVWPREGLRREEEEEDGGEPLVAVEDGGKSRGEGLVEKVFANGSYIDGLVAHPYGYM
jgi:hypothetical protein